MDFRSGSGGPRLAAAVLFFELINAEKVVSI
jgi:hypothetical protein